MKTISSNQFFAVVILIVSIAGLTLALPRFRAAFNNIPVDTAVDRINNEQYLALETIPRLIETGKKSTEFFDAPGYWEEISTLALYRAYSEDLMEDEALDSLTQGVGFIRQSLSRAPANSYLWYRLAMASYIQQAAAKTVADDLLMSIMTGPVETGIMLNRLRLGFRVFSEIKGDDRDSLVSQILLAWDVAPNEFLEVIAKERINRIFLMLLLKDSHPEIFNEMESAFENID